MGKKADEALKERQAKFRTLPIGQIADKQSSSVGNQFALTMCACVIAHNVFYVSRCALADGIVDFSVEDSMAGKQAIVLIHGIGEQRPMETLRGFVKTL